MHAKEFVTNGTASSLLMVESYNGKNHRFGLRRSSLVSGVTMGKLGCKVQFPHVESGGNKTTSSHSGLSHSHPGYLHLLFPAVYPLLSFSVPFPSFTSYLSSDVISSDGFP